VTGRVGDADFEVRPAAEIGVDENVAIDHSVLPSGCRYRLRAAGDDSRLTSRAEIYAQEAIIVEQQLRISR
jgi:hypothetical protein